MATKKQQLAAEVARVVGAGRAVALETVDFNDPNRPKTCLEVDFPILPVNQVAVIEGNAGKPIYQMSKWWARRRSSVFRAMLIAAATKAPDDKAHAAKHVWDHYYANHQKKGAFAHLKVADIFMGGGTTLVEGSRLGMQMTGNDINPVAWFVVKQELADVDIEEVKRLLADIEAQVKPQIMPFYACDGPNGEKGVWTHIASGEVMGAGFDPLALTPKERPAYRYAGPEIIYTFWAKHGPCQVTGCGHRTPIMASPVMAVKTLTVKAWGHTCTACGGHFEVEDRAARMAPDVPLVVAASEAPFATWQRNGQVRCPHCQHSELLKMQRGASKKVAMTLLVHPQWLAGSAKQDADGLPYGGSAQDDAASTARWNSERASKLRLLEVRGELPAEVTCPETGVAFKTDAGTVPKKSHYACGACGTVQDVLTTVKATGKTGPMAQYAVQGYAPKLDAEGGAYCGRFFAAVGTKLSSQFDAAAAEWEARKDGDLSAYWPKSELPYGFMTHMNNGGIPNHGFTHWWTMFNPRQLLVHAQLLKAICEAGIYEWPIREFVLGAFQQYLRNLNNFCIWDISRDGLAPHLSNKPGLFANPQEMVAQRHRLNSVMFRRTKADACRPDGSPLFARRWVHTDSFVMNDGERRFYERLREYLDDGFDLAKRQGNTGRALGFLMAIFQKIAASSFAAVRRTLQRRLLMLTLHEALLRDRDLDVDGRERLLTEARELVHLAYALPHDRAGDNECERVLADLKYRLVKRLDEEALEQASDPYGNELAAARAEEAASAAVEMHLPEERMRIGELLAAFPAQRETKVQKLLDGLGTLWNRDAAEKVVIFATYLGTVDLIGREIEAAFPGQGVVVLRGGDHGAKVAAERRFKQQAGPRVMVCTAAGREGINLQFARVLFNFDLPWNPMDVEQRIGRIHRYGQRHTAQVYNLVLSDTIEGRIYLLLEDKLTEIAKAVGKVDQHGEVAEDLRAQILGQLSERLNYDKLYQEALSDPTLKRTQIELEAALSNSREAREVVFDLFQDLDGFSLDDYAPLADTASSLERLERFLGLAVQDRGWALCRIDAETVELQGPESGPLRFTKSRDAAGADDKLQLLGLDHGTVQAELARWAGCSPDRLGASVVADLDAVALLTIWRVEASADKGLRRVTLQAICMTVDGTRQPGIERHLDGVFGGKPRQPSLATDGRTRLFSDAIEPALQRELALRAGRGHGGYAAELLACVELAPRVMR